MSVFSSSPNPTAWHRVSSISTALVVVIGVLVLLGWSTGQTVFYRVVAGWSATTPSTAAGLLLLGISIRGLLVADSRNHFPRYVIVLGGMLMAWGLVSILQHLMGVSWAMNRWWFGLADTESSGLMSGITAWTFVISASGLLCLALGSQSIQWFVGVCGLFTSMVGFSGILGNLLNADTLSSLPGFQTLAFPTSIGFLAGGVALSSFPRDESERELFSYPAFEHIGVRVVVPMVVGLPLILAGLVSWLGIRGLVPYDVAIPVATGFYVLTTGGILWRTREKLKTAESMQRASEEKRQISEHWAREMVDSLPQPVWTCQSNGECDYLSPRWIEYTGVPLADQLGKGWMQALHPDDRGRISENWTRVADLGKRFSTDYRLRRHDGIYRWFHALANPVTDSSGNITQWFGSSTDIDDMKVSAAVVTHSRDQLEELVALRTIEIEEGRAALAEAQKVARMGSWSLDIPNDKMKWSSEMFQLFDLPEAEAAPTFEEQQEFFTANSWKQLQAQVSGAIENGTGYTLELNYIRADGVAGWAEVRSRIELDGEGNAKRLTGTFQDITSRKKMDLVLAEREKQLQRSNEDLAQFAYVASHDLQEPLRAVSGCVQLLQKRYSSQFDERGNELIQHTVEGARRMQQLILDLLSYSRVGSRGLEKKMVSLQKPFNTALQNLHAPIAESGANIRLAGELPTLFVDEARIAQLMQNLIGNALKYRHPTEPPEITIEAQRQEDFWEISVRDNGIGVAPNHFDRIFEIFQRLHSRSDYSGSGIGLSICNKIVQRHGGEIWIEACPAPGALFKFTLPRNAQSTSHESSE